MQRVRQKTIAKWRALATTISNSLRLTMLIAATHTAIGKKIIAMAKFRSCLGSLSILLPFSHHSLSMRKTPPSQHYREIDHFGTKVLMGQAIAVSHDGQRVLSPALVKASALPTIQH
jgi:hypothetical protein